MYRSRKTCTAVSPLLVGAAMLTLVLGPSQAAVSAADDPASGSGETIGFALTGLLQTMDEKPNCPKGLNQNMLDYLLAAKPAEERARLLKDQNAQELFRLTRTVQSGEFKGQPLCYHPETTVTPAHKVVEGAAKIAGLDLDGAGSLNKPSGKSCAHRNFTSQDGREVIDNQLYRVRGCITGEHLGGIARTTSQGTLIAGAYSVLVEISGVNDRRNDPDVEVGIYSSSDPTPFSRSGKSMPWGSMTVTPDKKFWARTKGRIVNGVLTTEATKIALYAPSGNMKYELNFHDARVQLTLNPDGTAEGVLGGYRKVDEYYFNHIELRRYPGSADQWAYVGNFMCPSVYRALHDYADGMRNPQTGQCEGISTALVLTAQPAFVVK